MITPSSDPPSKASWPGRILIAIAWLWITVVSFIGQGLVWLEPFLDLEGGAVLLTAGQAGVIGLPLLPLALLWRRPRQRAVFQTWLGAAGFLLVLSPARLFLPTQGQLMTLAQLGLTLLYLGFVAAVTRRRAGPVDFFRSGRPRQSAGRSGLSLTLALAALLAYPWLAWGALGSPLDTLLSLAAGLAAGLTAGFILRQGWLARMTAETRGRGWNLFSGGLVSGTMLLIMAGGLSFNGVQLLLMLTLPSLGWAATGLSYISTPEPETAGEQPGAGDRSPAGAGKSFSPGAGQGFSRHWLVGAWLMGLSTAAVLALIDPDGLLLVGQDPLIGWSFRAAGVSVLLGWGSGLVVALAGRRLGGGRAGRLAWGGAGGLWLAGLAIYFVAGQPGFYGDRLFVILKEQADVSAAVAIADHDDRRRFVYESLVVHAADTQAGLRAALETFGLDYTPYYLVNAVEVRGGLLHRLWLASRPEVDRVIPSPRLRPLAGPPDPATGEATAPADPPWNLTNIGADRVWSELGTRGEGIIIGQSDSGVQVDHPELAPTYRGRTGGDDYNWFDPWTGSPHPIDVSGHGTHTLGSIVGQNVGVAPGATWFACANLIRNIGNPALYLDCMQFMLAPFPPGGDPFTGGDPTRAAHILNNSWGCPRSFEGCDPASLLPAVKALRAAGLFVVVSAGNDGPECSTVADPPAIYDEVFSVGAVDRFNKLAPFSSAGPVLVDGSGRLKPDIVAPGAGVLSAFPGEAYTRLDGTSMAAPHVAGVVALLWSANPALIGDIDRTEQILIESATPFTATLAQPDLQEALGQLVDEETAEEMAATLPEPEAPPLAGTCLRQTNLDRLPNNVAGYGVVNAYEAVKLALEN